LLVSGAGIPGSTCANSNRDCRACGYRDRSLQYATTATPARTVVAASTTTGNYKVVYCWWFERINRCIPRALLDALQLLFECE
jgi:hypothetical protein